jgi:hypothetical protein
MRRPSEPREHLWSPPQISQGLALLTDFSFVLADSAIGPPFIVDYPCEKAVVYDTSLLPTVVTSSSVIAFLAFAVGFAVFRLKGFLVADLAACVF